MRLRIVPFLLCFIYSFTTLAQREQEVEFFAFLNMMEGDSVKRSLEYDITYIQSVGFNGVGYKHDENLKETLKIIDDYDFKTSVVALKVNIDSEQLEPYLKERIKLLKGSKSILMPSFYSKSGKYLSRSIKGDAAAARAASKIAQLARKSKLEVAISPRYGCYVSTHTQAYELAKSVGRLTVGFSFNLSDWLATSSMEERNSIYSDLMNYIGKLKVVTINGANRVITEKVNPYDDYLLPLGQGTFDTYLLVEYLILKQGYSGPIGVQCEGTTGDKMQLAEDVMLVWKSYLSFMKESKIAD